VPVARFRDDILTQVRRTAAFGIICLKNAGALRGPNSAFRQRLARVAAQFEDDDHWETYAAQAFSCHADRDFDLAVSFYDKAIATIRADANVCDLPDWVHQATELQLSRQRAEAEQDL